MSLRARFVRFISRNIRVKVTIGVVLPLLVILGAFTWIEQAYHRKILLQNLSALASISGKIIESNLHRSMLKTDFDSVQAILDSINAHGDFKTIYLLNTSGTVIFSPGKVGAGMQLNNRDPGCIPCHRLPADQRPSSVVVTTEGGERLFRSMYPIRNLPECATCHDPQQKIIGLLLTDIPTTPMQASLSTDLLGNLLWWLGTILVTILIVNLALNWFVLGRLQRFGQTIRNFGQNLNLRMQTGEPDELGRLAQTFNEMGQRIETEAHRNQVLSGHLKEENEQRGELLKRLINAQEDERKRVARELHDDLGQSLSALLFQAKIMERLLAGGPPEAIDQLNTTETLIADTTDRMYDLILALRPSILDELGLVAALRAHARRNLEESGIQFTMEIEGMTNRLPAALETNLYRIFQEAINNVRRHAQASNVSLVLTRANGTVTGELRDDGCGFDPAFLKGDHDDPRGLGVLSMQERAALCGGTLEVISQTGQGTTIQVRMPVEEACG